MSDWSLEAVQRGGERDLARLLSFVENCPLSDLVKLTPLFKGARPALRIGITGAPGVGKSSLVGGLLLAAPGPVGALLVDPSSPLSRGAVLGDRIRLFGGVDQSQTRREHFVRSVGARGGSGGLGVRVGFMLRAMSLFNCQSKEGGFDYMVVETVGVGQSDIDLGHLVDVWSLVLAPGAGDEVQLLKAGVLEVAPHVIVNKSDLEGAEALARALRSFGFKPFMLQSNKANTPAASKAFRKLWDFYASHAAGVGDSPTALRHEALALARALWEQSIQKDLSSIHSLRDFVRFVQSLR